MSAFAQNIVREIDRLADCRFFGRVSGIVGLLVEVEGLQGCLSIGDHCRVRGRNGAWLAGEVVGFRSGAALLMPFGPLDGIGVGCRAEVMRDGGEVHPHENWLGRVINAFGEPIDGKGPLTAGARPYRLQRPAPPAHQRNRVGGKIDLGVRAMNGFLTCCQGQRMGVFAGSGVGKSTLLSMMARHTDAEINIIGLVGERGREAREFIEDSLGAEGMRRSVVIVATSDEPPPVRRQAAYMTMAVAEYFRDGGAHVLCMMDSVTRFAMAQREIALAVGEPPASKGYTPSVFAELPRLLERAGPGIDGQGSITGLFTVLVEGDDHNEPVSDAVRGILDGHVVLDRTIAERGRFPAINVLRSVSRTMPACNSARENEIIGRARRLLSTYEDIAELVRLGAYQRGTDPAVDEAIHHYPALDAYLSQTSDDRTSLSDTYERLAEILGMTAEAGPAQTGATDATGETSAGAPGREAA